MWFKSARATNRKERNFERNDEIKIGSDSLRWFAEKEEQVNDVRVFLQFFR